MKSAILCMSLLFLLSTLVVGDARQSFSRLRRSDEPASSSSSSKSMRKCLMCKFSVSLINYALKTNRGYEEVAKVADNFCNIAKIDSPLVCSSVTKLFNHEVTKVLSYGIITPDQVCGYLSNNTCGKFHNPLDDWEVNLNISYQLNNEELAQRQQIDEALKEPQPAYRVIHISDTHVDLKYKTGAPAVCEEPLCCQVSSTQSNKSDAKAGYWGSYGLCDIPIRTFESALKVLNSTLSESKDIDYIIWTGDVQPHDVWAQSKKSANKIYDAVFGLIFRYLPNITILPTFGNHEMIPVDSFSPSNLLSIAKDDSPVWLYKKLDSFWSRWLPAKTVDTITKDGFYSASIRKGLKVISLNTNFCHTKNFWLYINSTDPGNQLQWLIHELQISELIHEKVHIIGHIPPGADDCMKVWSKNYNRILRRYSKTITGQFFGHTHTNEFEMFYDTSNDHMQNQAKQSDISSSQPAGPNWIPISVGHIGPSITTFVDLNPSFRIYNVDPNAGFAPVDFETFFMNLTKANLMGPMQPTWESAGFFSKRFSTKDTSPQSMHALLVDVAQKLNSGVSTQQEELDSSPTRVEGPRYLLGEASDDQLYELYLLYNSYSDRFNRSVYDKISLDDKRKFVCRLFTGQAHDPDVCNEFIRDPRNPTKALFI